MKASRATSDIIRSVNGTITRKPSSRTIIDTRPNTMIPASAMNAAWRAAGSAAPRVMASTSRPENTGINRSAMVAPTKPPAVAAASNGWFSQWRNANGSTAAGRFSF